MQSHVNNMQSSGQTLYNNKEVKDLFVNVVDKIVEPLKQYKFSTEDLQNVMNQFDVTKMHSL